jgi:hypothetical protein
MSKKINKRKRDKSNAIISLMVTLMMLAPLLGPGTVKATGGSYTATAYSDFEQTCAVKSGAAVYDQYGGEITMSSSFRDDFSGSSLSNLWASGVWTSGHTYTPSPSGGSLTVSGSGGAYIMSNNTQSVGELEFRATFSSHNWQHIGYTSGTDFDKYIIFSTKDNGEINARVRGSGSETLYTLGSSYLGSAHNYKIQWWTDEVKFWIDDVLVAVHNENISDSLKVVASNNDTNSSSVLSLDWIERGVSSVDGSYTSCSIDSGSNDAAWGSVNYTLTRPNGTGFGISTRTSNDGVNWSSYSSISNGGFITSPRGRYLQYQLSFSKFGDQAPTLKDITVNYITALNTSTSVYTASTYADFNQTGATTSGAELTNTSGGEITRSSILRDDFEASTLSSLWSSGVWETGTTYSPAPSNGQLSVVGNSGSAYIISNNSVNSENILEFEASFTQHNWQHVGLTDGTDFGYFALFSTKDNGQLNARVNNSTYPLGARYFNDNHVFRIESTNSQVKFYIDGDLVATHSGTIGVSYVKVIASNNSLVATSGLSVRYLNVDNYPTGSGTYYYRSASIDSGTSGNAWGTINYTKVTPLGTTINVYTRTSDDGINWTGWSTATSGSAVGSASGRYLQYEVQTNSFGGKTPVLKDISIAHN